MKVKILELDTPTHSGYIYPKDEMERAVKVFNERDHSVGELTFPDIEQNLIIDLSRVSHKIEEVWVEDNTVYAEVALMETPHGTIAKQLIECGAGRFAPRGVGNVDEKGVVTNFQFVSIDCVRK